AFHCAMAAQSLSVVATAIAAVAAMRAAFRLRAWIAALLFALLLSPFYTLDIGNLMLSEAVTYGFFLCFLCAVALQSSADRSRPPALAAAAASIALCTLARAQMVVLWAGFVLLVVFVARLRKDGRAWRSGAACLVAAALACSACRAAYNRVEHGAFRSVGPWFLLTQSLVL